MGRMVTTAMANKMVRQLTEEKEFLMNREAESCTYTAAVDEEPLIPEYDFEEMNAQLESIDQKVMRIRHAINVANSTNTIRVGGEDYTIDQILVRLAQLNKRKDTLDSMRRQLPKKRRTVDVFSSNSFEYQYTNYDIERVREEFERINNTIMEMQMNLDKYNQTVEIEVPV